MTSHAGRKRESGQSTAEYAVVIAGIVALCALAALFIGVAVGNQLGSTTKPAGRAPFEPPTTQPELEWPATLDDCEDGKWRNYAQFRNEAQCTEYVRRLRQ